MLPPLWMTLCLLGMLVLHAIWPLHLVRSPLTVVGLLPALLGLGVSFAAKARFRRLDTEVNTFADPGRLVTDGLYAVSRNPMYLGMALALGGVGIVLGSAWGLAGVVLFVAVTDRHYIAYEERRMLAVFGSAYEVYRARTRRWI